jgi:UDP-N-acetylglucosamine 2-epimerase (non-hydrolysing)
MSTSKQTVQLIAAARPNFMKIAPLYHALRATDWAEPVIVHTGQHYDLNMSDAFFQDLRLPAPHIHLGAGTGSHAEQTGKVMMAYEKTLLETRPDMTVVVGDVNSTLACTLAAVKLTYPEPNTHGRTRPVVAHLEAGLRSFDRSMPEEVNRLATDVLADLLWTPSPDGDENLHREGIAADKIHRVGNIMIDSLEMMRAHIAQAEVAEQLSLPRGDYAVATLHRPGNVDDPAKLLRLCELLIDTARHLPVVFPVHPRTRKNLAAANLLARLEQAPGIRLLEPQSYIRFMSLVFDCRLVITDSGGIQEETTYLGIPCLTLRPNTERPITITQGTNRLCSLDNVADAIAEVIAAPRQPAAPPELWDGQTAVRTAERIRIALC